MDFSAGLSAMGTAVAKTAGDYLADEHRGQLDMEKVKLADQLADVREGKERTFKAGESLLNRQSSETIADKQVAGQIEGHKISAGATTSAAAISAMAHVQGARLTNEAAHYTADKHLEGTRLYTDSREKVATISAEAKEKAAKIVAEARTAISGSLVPSADALETLAVSYNATGTLPQTGYGGAAGKTAILNRAAAMRKEMGVSDENWMDSVNQAKFAEPAAKALQKQYSAVEAYSATAEKNGDIVKELLSKGVGPTGMPIFDAWIQSGRRMTGDDEVAKFGAAIYAYSIENAKVMSGAMGNTPLSDSARKEMEANINKAMNTDQLLGVMGVMDAERANRMAGFQEQMQKLNTMAKGKTVGPAPVSPGATPGNPNPTPGAPKATPAATMQPLPTNEADMREGVTYNVGNQPMHWVPALRRMMPGPAQ